MKLESLLEGINVESLTGSLETDINSIHYYSGKVEPGGLFVAIRGYRVDGHDYIEDAIKRGAQVVVSEKDLDVPPYVTLIRVRDTRLTLSRLAANFYGQPSKGICLIGVTGTNGKTTTAYLAEAILNARGYSTGVIGTINYRFLGNTYTSLVTTPESVDLQRILREMADGGVTHVVLEVSSHALALHRVADCYFDIGVFTNLSRDHLDYHKDMDSYYQCKKSLFLTLLNRGPKKDRAVAVINCDDPKGRSIYDEMDVTGLSVGLSDGCMIRAHDLKVTQEGIHGIISTPEGEFSFRSPLTGLHNAHNILNAVGIGISLGIPLKQIKAGVEGLKGVPGRMERIGNRLGLHIFVDYAHTPDALERVLTTLKSIASNRIITVFGCGGERDREKRPLMGSAAGRLSDLVIVTADNPRNEPVDQILSDIVQGTKSVQPYRYEPEILFKGVERPGYVVEADRRSAIRIGIHAARRGDIVLIAGKGHETYQICGEHKIPFDDREEARRVLKEIEANQSWIDLKGSNSSPL